MSGGHWEYMRERLENPTLQMAREYGKLLGQIEHELDWGICCDSCHECAKLRVAAAIEQFFDDGGADARLALAVLMDRERTDTICLRCLHSTTTHWRAYRNPGAVQAAEEELLARIHGIQGQLQ